MSEQRQEIKKILDSANIGKTITAKGWVRTRRGNKQVQFITLNDGSTIHNLQIVADGQAFPEESLKDVTTGSSIAVTGEIVASQGSGQNVEMIAKEIIVIGKSHPDEYPLQPKKHSLE
ncbi:MAG: OB-fold nucleic acid binding domain-containing protein, partial [Bacteroidales bacterium]